ncbi:MAG: hypothetical protein AAGU75_20455, partial [Bacillota bacterium]
MRRKILISVVLLTLLPVLLIGFFSNYYTQMAIQNTKQEMLAGTVNMMDFRLTQYYERVLSNIKEKTESSWLKKLLIVSANSSVLDNDTLIEIRK